MFTVKHRESPALGGNEYIHSAETIEVVFPGPAKHRNFEEAWAALRSVDHKSGRHPIPDSATIVPVAGQTVAAGDQSETRLQAMLEGGAQADLSRGAMEQTAGNACGQGTSNMFECGIFLDREPPPAPGEARTRFSKHIILFGGDQTQAARERCGGKVWVMNEQGATVATYDL